MSIIVTLILAWLLTCFNLDTIIVGGINELLGTNYSTNVYWLGAIIIAILVFFIKSKVRKESK